MKFWSSGSLQSIKDLSGLTRFVSMMTQNLQQVLRNNITFKDNMKCQIVDFYFELSSTSYAIKHGLGVIPIGFMIIRTSRDGTNPGIIYWDGSPEWTTSTIFLRSQTNEVSARILIIGA